MARWPRNAWISVPVAVEWSTSWLSSSTTSRKTESGERPSSDTPVATGIVLSSWHVSSAHKHTVWSVEPVSMAEGAAFCRLLDRRFLQVDTPT